MGLIEEMEAIHGGTATACNSPGKIKVAILDFLKSNCSILAFFNLPSLENLSSAVFFNLAYFGLPSNPYFPLRISLPKSF